MIQKLNTLNCRGRLVDLSRPRIMGILNLTPDSFSDGGKYNRLDLALSRVSEMLEAGATFIDVGGYSSRPGAIDISPEEELKRTEEVIKEILAQFPEALVSVDTFRAEVAAPLLDMGVHLINDISGGELDPEMMGLVSRYQVPYILMHMKGNPRTMQQEAEYGEIIKDIWGYFVKKVNQAREEGIVDIILDPGFGFAKTRTHNYQLLNQLEQFTQLGMPLLVGISRKSMLYKLVDTTPDDVLGLTSALHLKVLEQGVSILRTHDVEEARRICQLFEVLEQNKIPKKGKL